ncbi:MAG TPA: hypothetical protein DGT23_04610 [Micromonosporaceae bacterium]|nr:hypothetical protein [Micromonosporaceae bacterium]
MPPAKPAATRPSPTRISLTDSLTRLILAVFIIPAPFEIVTAIVKKEQYDFGRLGVVVVALMALALVLSLLRSRRVYVQSIVGYYLIVVGAAFTALGVAVTFNEELVGGAAAWSPAVGTTVSALAPSLGLLLIASGAYLIREQIRRAREELDTEGPSNITAPKTIKVNNSNASLWTSDIYGENPAAPGMVELCKKYLSTTDLHFIAYYTEADECLFYIDFLDEDAMARYNVADTPQRRKMYEQHGRHVRYLSSKLDKRFKELRSGILVRIVLDVEKGAIYYYKLRREGFLIGVTLEQTEVDPTDRKLSELANEILVYLGGRPDDDFYRK